ncbi:hypothetical protein ACFX11_044274 [Malus domestica]
MDANLQMIAKVATFYNNPSIKQAEKKYVAHGMPTEAAPKFLVEKMVVLSEESKGVESSNGRDVFGCCHKWSEFERRIATLEFDRDKKSTGVIVNSVLGEESLLVKGVVENLLEKSTKVQLLDGTVVPLDDSSRNYIVQALHEMSTSALKPLNDSPVLKLADTGIAMGISRIENMTITRERVAAFKQVPTSKFFSLVDKANFQGGSIVMTEVIIEVLCFITVRNLLICQLTFKSIEAV